VSLRAAVPRPLRLAASRWLAERASSRLHRELEGIAARSTPIVAGPWLGEVGFELLYWVPFLAWFTEQFQVAPDRLLVVSRGGTASWYQPFAGRYADAFDQVTPETFRAEHDARVRDIGEQKQTRLTEFERRLIAGAAATFPTTEWSLIHPSTMYELFRAFWWGHVDGEWIHRHARYRRLAPPAAPGEVALDASRPFAAVKFYFNECFPPTDADRAIAREMLRRLAAASPVVALSTGLNIDDHGGCTIEEPGIQHLPEGLPPARNLYVQSAVVSRARAFVGTYGGFAYLAPFYGVPSVALFRNPDGFSRRHLAMAHDAFDRIGSGGLLRVHDAAHGAEAILSSVAGHG
jgi:hypothetical protein